MRVPLGFTYAATSPNFRAGAIYIEVENKSSTQIIFIRFEGADVSNNIALQAGQKRIFPFIGSQGYAAFTLRDFAGGNIDSVFVLIIN